jgi:hypothetical protein
MNKKLFASCINAIEKQYKHNEKCAKRLSEVFPYSSKVDLHYDHHWITNALFEVLADAMGDKDNWIEYFLWELDFGAKNRSGKLKATDKDGNNIPLGTPEDLWELLNKERNG